MVAPATESKGHIGELRKELGEILDELEGIQKEMEEKPLDAKRGEEAEAKAKRAEEIQGELDRYEQLVKLRKTPVDPKLPPREHDDNDPSNGRGRKTRGRRSLDDVMTISPGDMFALSDEFQSFIQAGMPQAYSQAAKMDTLFGRIPLRGDALKKVTEKIEQKTVPVIGEGVIQPMWDPDMVRIPGEVPLTIRSLLRVVPTTSNLIIYTVYAFGGDGPAIVPHGERKPENAARFDTGRAPVVTVAKWIPVNEQELEDFSVLSATINDELLYELARFEEQQILWGDSDNGELSGLLNPATSVPEIPTPDAGRTPASVIEQVRMGITDVTLRGGSPTAAVLHPLDWEAAELAKGTDEHYLWVVVTDAGVRRLWGIRIVESPNMMNPATGNRQLLVGDFPRGATLYDRRAASIQVGWINDMFVRNQRAIRAEERLAFAVKRPHFFGRATPITANGDT